MKPIAIFRHLATEGPGHFAWFLNEHAIPWQMFHLDEGEAVPKRADQFSALVFMGGPMSVNDNLPWIADELALIRDAYAQDIPLLGHCLGGQLIAKALGGSVTANPVKEIGWGEVTVANNETARTWFGDLQQFDAFHWHGETFTLPVGAVPLLSSAHCANQAFAMGKHLAMQCHVEMENVMVRAWCEQGEAEVIAASDSPAVQHVDLILEQKIDKLPQLHQVANQLYRQWLHGLAPRAS
jgi:GMP synthase-like glutamine amidotransferase